MAVYFVRDDASNLVKIGLSSDPWARLSQMQSGSSAKLWIVGIIDGDRATERGLHHQFDAYHERGEWFRREGELASYIDGLPTVHRPVREVATRSRWNGMSNTELARATGIPGTTLTAIAKGRHRPSAAVAIELQRACGVSAIQLVFGDLAAEAR